MFGSANEFYLTGGLLVALLSSSFVRLKRAEAISYYTSARSHAAKGDMETAIQLFQRAIEAGPQVIDLEDTYSRLCLLLMGRGDQMDSALHDALQMIPSNPDLKVYRLALDSRHSDRSTRDSAWAGILDLGERDNAVIGKTFYNLGLGHEERNEYDQALSAYQTALEYDDRTAKLLKRIAATLVKAGRPGEAATVASQVTEVDPQDIQGLTLKAYALLDAGSVEESMALCKQLLAIDPDADLFVLLGDGYGRQGALDQAVQTYRQALDIDANHSVAHTNLGWVLYLQGKLEEAVHEYDWVVEHDPNSMCHFNLALAKLALGHLREARSQYAEAVERYGTAEGIRVGADKDLRDLVGRDIQATVAAEFLTTYWPADIGGRNTR